MSRQQAARIRDGATAAGRRAAWIALTSAVAALGTIRTARAQEGASAEAAPQETASSVTVTVTVPVPGTAAVTGAGAEPAPERDVPAEPPAVFQPVEEASTGQEPEPPVEGEVPPATVFHVPRSSAPADGPLEIVAVVAQAWQIDFLNLVYRRLDGGGWKSVPFRRTSTGDVSAVIPGSDVAAPAIEYYISSRDRKGTDRDHFASEGNPYRVEVIGRTAEQDERVRLDRYGGRRHRFSLRSDWNDFGNRSVAGFTTRPEEYTEGETRPRDDDYVDSRFEYAYRILGLVHSIHFGVGSMRGWTPRLDLDYDTGARDTKLAGYDYGWTAIVFEFHRYFAAGLDVYLGGSQLGFDGGGGGFLRIGNTAETHFDVACDYVSNIGYRAAFTFAWDTVPRVPMSLTAEFTNWVDPSDGGGDGVRLWFAASPRVWEGLIIDVRAGYAARHDSDTGGVIVGGGLAWEF